MIAESITLVRQRELWRSDWVNIRNKQHLQSENTSLRPTTRSSGKESRFFIKSRYMSKGKSRRPSLSDVNTHRWTETGAMIFPPFLTTSCHVITQLAYKWQRELTLIADEDCAIQLKASLTKKFRPCDKNNYSFIYTPQVKNERT